MHSLSRTEAPDQQSQDYLLLALESTATGRSAADAAYQAGYLALISALRANEVAAVVDHPSAAVTKVAAQRLQLQSGDQALAAAAAAGYYSPAQGTGQRLAEQIAWARRIRIAARWPLDACCSRH